jgi:hypothetical protein
MFHVDIHCFSQLYFLIIFGFWIIEEIRRLSSSDDSDCFIRFGDFSLCDSNQHLSIYSTLFLLQAQALIYRVLVPGMSIFVNASVRRLLLVQSFIMFEYVTPRTLRFLNFFRETLTPNICPGALSMCALV